MSINGGTYTSLVDNMGKFNVQVPSPGNYKVEVQNLNYHFEPTVVEIYESEFAPGKDTKAFLFSLKHGKDANTRLAYPLVLDPSGRFGYFEMKAPFDPWAYLKNPFVIMIGVTLLMSQMMKGIDQEELKKSQENQADVMKEMPQQCQQQ